MTDYYNDFDPGAAEWLRVLCAQRHIPAGTVDQRSIIDVQPDDLAGFRRVHFFAGIAGWAEALRLADWPEWLPTWTGSPPCQPFSAAGAGLGRDDPRHLGPQYARLVRSCRPPLLFGEQVASADAIGRAAGPGQQGAGAEPAWAWWDDMAIRLEAAGYAPFAAVVPAAGIGAPHIRQRLFFAAVDLRFTAGAAMPGSAGRADGGLAHANDAGLEGWRKPGRERATERLAGTCGLAGGMDAGGARPGPTSGFWSVADWLLCRDERWRPVEPGTFPLADGIPGRVGLLRGYGNAIVPQAAAVWIDSVRETLIEAGIWHALRAHHAPSAENLGGYLGGCEAPPTIRPMKSMAVGAGRGQRTDRT